MLVGGIVKIAANYILVGQPDVNINGAPIGTMCCYGVIAILNLIVIKKNYKEVSIVKMFSKTFVSAVVMGILFGSEIRRCCRYWWLYSDILPYASGDWRIYKGRHSYAA